MMERDRVLDFIHSFRGDDEPEILRTIRQEAQRDQVPIIRRDMEDLLRVLIRIRRPARILEVGSAIGFSSIFMALCSDAGTKITTIENYAPRVRRARHYIREADMADRIRLLFGDAAPILKTLDGSYDFVFMDAAKGQYIHFLPDILRLLVPGGVLVSDNVLQGGDIFQSRYAIRRRDHTIHQRMRDYLYALTHHEELDTVILECGDGACLTVRRGQEDRGFSGIRSHEEEE